VNHTRVRQPGAQGCVVTEGRGVHVVPTIVRLHGLPA
jgi:hypothetical protein